MIIRQFFAGFAVLFATPLMAQAPSLTSAQERNVERLIDAALEDDLAWDLVESLTTEIGPRLGGSPEEARARDWGVEKLKALGFKNVRIETFEMSYWSRIAESAEIVSPYPQELKITALGNSVATPENGLTGEVVRFRTLLELQDAPMEGFEGKVIFVDEVMTRTQDGSGYGWAVAKRSGAANEAARRGAAAALIRSAGTSAVRTPHTGNMRYADDVTPVPIAALSNPDADQLARAMRLADGPVSVKLDISVHTKSVVESGNVIGEIPGETDEIILIGGHLDSWDLGTGAVDDGAGVAITTAAAKLIGDLPGRPTRTIRVIMWGAEEVGLVGARAYAAQHANELDRHVLASESDFGAGRVFQFRTGFAQEALPKAQVYQKALRRLGIGPGHNFAGGGPDVTPLRQAGVPVFRLYQDGTDYFDLHHTSDDTLEKIDPEALQQNVAAWAATVYIASELEGDYRAPAQQE
ncbi:MAG: M20/M25/M40 family metallo-hydrolase [Pseudomonadota bacterium]